MQSPKPPGCRSILYNYPARSGVEIGFDCLDLVADHPLIVGIKESSGDFSRFLALRDRYGGRITVMCGSDDQAADYFVWGVRSWLAGTANVLPRQHVDILKAANSGDLDGARKQFEQILPWVQHMEAGSYNQKAKLGLRHLGIDCGEVRAAAAAVERRRRRDARRDPRRRPALMRLARSYAAVEVHAEGEQGTCYLGSVFGVPGLTARESCTTSTPSTTRCAEC